MKKYQFKVQVVCTTSTIIVEANSLQEAIKKVCSKEFEFEIRDVKYVHSEDDILKIEVLE